MFPHAYVDTRDAQKKYNFISLKVLLEEKQKREEKKIVPIPFSFSGGIVGYITHVRQSIRTLQILKHKSYYTCIEFYQNPIIVDFMNWTQKP